MLDNFIFYNYYGNGDIFHSREFVKDLIKQIPANSFYYAHGKSPRILEDIQGLKYMKIPKWCRNDRAFVKNGNDVAINTWIGRDGKYVLSGITCTASMNYLMYNNILRDMGLNIRLSGTYIDYLPTIDFNFIRKDYRNRIDKFISDHPEKKVLISNGDVFSAQAVNFDFTPIIDIVCDRNPSVTFIASSPTPLRKSNLYYTEEIIKTDDNFDLNEIAYMSLFINYFIGRSSGPFMFAQIKENCMNPDKIFLTFTKHPNCRTFAHDLPVKMQVYWSGAVSTEKVARHIQEVINK